MMSRSTRRCWQESDSVSRSKDLKTSASSRCGLLTGSESTQLMNWSQASQEGWWWSAAPTLIRAGRLPSLSDCGDRATVGGSAGRCQLPEGASQMNGAACGAKWTLTDWPPRLLADTHDMQ